MRRIRCGVLSSLGLVWMLHACALLVLGKKAMYSDKNVGKFVKEKLPRVYKGLKVLMARQAYWESRAASFRTSGKVCSFDLCSACFFLEEEDDFRLCDKSCQFCAID